MKSPESYFGNLKKDKKKKKISLKILDLGRTYAFDHMKKEVNSVCPSLTIPKQQNIVP